MNSNLKVVIRCAIYAMLSFIIILGVVIHRDIKRAHYERYIECDPNDIFEALDAPAPTHAAELCTARSRFCDGGSRYLMKFEMPFTLLTEYLKSIDDNAEIWDETGEFQIYAPYGFKPEWLKKTIKYNKAGAISWNRKYSSMIYIEADNTDNCIIYIQGGLPRNK